MSELLDMILAGRTLEQALADDARAIKAIGEDHTEKTFGQKIEHGYVTAKIFAVPKGAERR
jgi:hypothetical protein